MLERFRGVWTKIIALQVQGSGPNGAIEAVVWNVVGAGA